MAWPSAGVESPTRRPLGRETNFCSGSCSPLTVCFRVRVRRADRRGTPLLGGSYSARRGPRPLAHLWRFKIPSSESCRGAIEAPHRRGWCGTDHRSPCVLMKTDDAGRIGRVFVQGHSDSIRVARSASRPASYVLLTLAIQARTRASSMSRGSAPPFRITSWNARMSNFGPSSVCARWRSSRIFNWPSL